jgi:hypothetical protein
MIRANRPLFLSALALLALLSVVAPAAAVTTTIAHARTLPLGTVVTVEGTISTPSGAFESSFFDKGFGLQQGNAGIFISLPTTDLHVGIFRRARVTGVLADSAGLLLVVPADPSDVHLLGLTLPVVPRWVETAAVGEATEGRIVRVVGRVSTAPSSDLPFGYKLGVDDGSGEVQIFINTQTGIDPFALSLHQLVSISGFSSQFDTHYEIDPRFPADIIAVGH